MSLTNLPQVNTKSPFASMKGHHVAVRVPDYEAAKKWYVEKLDFRVVHEWPFGDLSLAYVAPANDNNFFVEILGNGQPNAKSIYHDVDSSLHDGGYHHFCMNVESVDDTIAELRRRGVTIIGEPFELETINRRLGFFTDPWGNMIELAQILS